MTVQGGGALTGWWTCRRSSSAAESESIDKFEPQKLQETYWCVSLKLGCRETTNALTDWWNRRPSSATEPESTDKFEPQKLQETYWCVSLKLGCRGTTHGDFHSLSVSA